MTQTEYYLLRRKSEALNAAEDGIDEQDFYFCPTCYAVIGDHDIDGIEYNYCPNCGQKLKPAKRYEANIQDYVRSAIQTGLLTAEVEDDMFMCQLNGEIPFVSAIIRNAYDSHETIVVNSITETILHPGACGISKEIAERIIAIIQKGK